MGLRSAEQDFGVRRVQTYRGCCCAARDRRRLGLVGTGVGGSVLVGRDVQVGLLRGLVSAVADGRGGEVWVEGEPGIGKSAVLAAGLADAAGLGCQAFRAAADELSQ